MMRVFSPPRPDGLLRDLTRQLAYRPLVLMAVGLAAGIALAETLELPFSAPLLVLCLAVAALALVLGRLSGTARLWLVAVFLSLGVLLHSLHSVVPAHHLIHRLPLDQVRLAGRLAEVPRETAHGRRLVLDCEWLGAGPGWQQTAGRVALFQAGGEPALHTGDRVAVSVDHLEGPRQPTNPSQFDARRYYRQRGLCAQGTARDLQVEPGPPTARGRAEEFVAARQQAALAALQRAMPGDDPAYYAGLLGGMVYGQRAAGPVGEPTEELFRRTGTVHLLVVSGAQITFIILALIFLVSGRGRWALQPWHLLLIFPPMLAFSLFAGIAGSVVRGLIMAGVLAYALVSHHDYEPYSALALAALALMVADTNAVFDVGTQLTFAACLGVVAFPPHPRTDEWTGHPTRPSLLVTVFWAGVGAWALTTPIIVVTFHGLPLLGNLANLLAVPLSMLIMPLGMVALLTGAWLLPVTTAVCWLCRLLINLMLSGNRLCEALPGAYVDLVEFGPLLTAAWYAVVGGGLLLVARSDLRRRFVWPRSLAHRDRLFLAGGMVLAGVVVASAVMMAQSPRLTLSVLDVGEGNCFLVQAPGGGAMMIDAGAVGDGATLAQDILVPYLAHRGVRRLDCFLLTHGDADHCNALQSLLTRVPVGEYVDPLLGGAPTYLETLADVQRRGVPVRKARAGGEVQLGGGVTALLVAPGDPLLAWTGADENNNSAAVLLRYGGTRVLIMGDQQEPGLARLTTGAEGDGLSLQAQVVVLPHHGRSAPWCGDLLRRSGARWALVSGSRGPLVRKTLGGSVRVVSTGEIGAIEVVSDGREVRVRRAR